VGTAFAAERWAVAQATVDELRRHGDQWKLDVVRAPDEETARQQAIESYSIPPSQQFWVYGKSLMRVRVIFQIEQSLTNTIGWF